MYFLLTATPTISLHGINRPLLRRSSLTPCMETMSVHPSVSKYQRLKHFIKFGARGPYEKLSNKCTVRENRCSERHNSTKALNEFLPAFFFHIYWHSLVKFGVNNSSLRRLANFGFMKICRVKATRYVGAHIKCCTPPPPTSWGASSPLCWFNNKEFCVLHIQSNTTIFHLVVQ